MIESEVTLLLLRIGFLVLLWFFVFAVVYALRADLFGTRARKLPEGADAVAPAAQPLPAARKVTRGIATPAPLPQVPPGVPIAPPQLSGAAAAGAAMGAGQAANAAAVASLIPTPAHALTRSASPAPSPTIGGKATTSTVSRIVITSGPKAGLELPLGTEPLTIGRSSEAGLVIRDDFTSSHHARLVLWGEQWMVQDLDSTNGTWLGGKRIASPVPVSIGEPIKVGATTFELRK